VIEQVIEVVEVFSLIVAFGQRKSFVVSLVELARESAE
jgi:hypothetical protein